METGRTAATEERENLCLQSRLEHIESQAKRFCTSIRDEVSHLKSVSTKAEAASKAAENEKAEAEEVAKQAHAAAAAEVEADKAALVAERAAMEHLQVFPSTIELDIGGTRFKTSRTTLLKHHGSFLESMFSGRHEVAAAPDGSYFIDRDPAHFRVILNFLRCGAAITPVDPVAKAEAAAEAEFYGLPGLQRALAHHFMPGLTHSAHTHLTSCICAHSCTLLTGACAPRVFSLACEHCVWCRCLARAAARHGDARRPRDCAHAPD